MHAHLVGVAPGLNGGFSDPLAFLWVGLCVCVYAEKLGFGGKLLGSHFLSQAPILERPPSLISIPCPLGAPTTESDYERRLHTNRLPSGSWSWLRVPPFAQQWPWRSLSWITFPTHLRVGGRKERHWGGLISLEAPAGSSPVASLACFKPKLCWSVCWL